jgi:hypothetical protein
LAWSENHVDDIMLITPMHVAVYIEQHPGSPPTVKQDMTTILLGVLAYTFARTGAAVNLRVEDYYATGKWFLLRFN